MGKAIKTGFTKGALKSMADRVAAVRAELSELAPGSAMAKAVGRDLFVLEVRLADAMVAA